MSIDFVALFYFLVALAYFSWNLSHQTTKHSSARATRLRSAQLPLVFAFQVVLFWGLHKLGWKSALAVIPPVAIFYWGLRFGKWRIFFGAILCAFVVSASRAGKTHKEIALGLAIGAVSTFLVDMAWNRYLKRKGVFL